MSSPGLTDDGRFELAMAAAGRERANRPRGLVVIAVAALVVAGIAAALGLGSRASARAGLTKGLAEQSQVEQMIGEWRALLEQEAAGAAGAPGLGEKLTDLYSRMELLASRAGIKDKPQFPSPDEVTRGGIKVIQYRYNGIKEPSPKPLLEWLRLAVAEVPGMEVYSVSLKPDPTNWTMNVTFRRWERVQ